MKEQEGPRERLPSFRFYDCLNGGGHVSAETLAVIGRFPCQMVRIVKTIVKRRLWSLFRMASNTKRGQLEAEIRTAASDSL